MNGAYKDFPPGWNHLRIPTSSRRSAMAGLALYSACKPRGLWSQRVAWLGVALLGPQFLPGRARPWVPLDDGEWKELQARWRSELGRFDAIAGYQRTLSSRRGFAVLLLRDGAPLAFAKLRPRADAEAGHQVEEQALRLVASRHPRTFSVPELRSSGTVGDWRYFCTSTLPPGLHHPPTSPPLDAIVEEIEACLEGLPRPASTPGHWRRMHGDLTPYNLRESGRQLFLVDWEHAGWGPPHTDTVGYRTTAAALGVSVGAGEWSPPASSIEAIRYWTERVTRHPPASRREEQYGTALRRVLGRLERAAANAADLGAGTIPAAGGGPVVAPADDTAGRAAVVAGEGAAAGGADDRAGDVAAAPPADAVGRTPATARGDEAAEQARRRASSDPTAARSRR